MAKKVNVTPLHDRVIVKAAAAEEKPQVVSLFLTLQKKSPSVV